MYEKDFAGWQMLKENLSARDNTSVPTIKEREIWWCSIGVNIGDEEDGKNNLYNRPVLIIKKFNARIFWGVPLTTQLKPEKHYFQIDFKEKEVVSCSHTCASMTQGGY